MTAPRMNKLGAVFLHVTDLERSSRFTEEHEGKTFLYTCKDPDGNVLMVMQEH